MGVKVVEMYPGKWYVRVVYNHFRKTKQIGSKERALEVSRKLTTTLELYGFDVLFNPVMKLGKFYRSAKKIKEKIDPLTIGELHLIEATCQERFPKHYPFILCMARTGMRIGEATALRWIDIDFEKNYIIVRRNIPHHRQAQTTKTEASQRKVDMSPELSAELKRLRTERKKQALADGKVFDPEEWVFPNEDGTPIYYTNFLRRVWHKVQDTAKIRRRTPHDLRHSWASHMLWLLRAQTWPTSQISWDAPIRRLP